MGSFSIWHWLIVLAIVVVLFGTKKLGDLGSDLGRAVKEFKDGVRSEDEKAESAPAIAPAAVTGNAPAMQDKPRADDKVSERPGA